MKWLAALTWPMIFILGLVIASVFFLPLVVLFLVALGASPETGLQDGLTFGHIRATLSQPLNYEMLLRSLGVAALASCVALLVAVPLALFSALWREKWSFLFLLFLCVPFWTADLILVLSWQQSLSPGGWIYASLLWFGLPAETLLGILYGKFAVWMIFVHFSIPLAAAITYHALQGIDGHQIEAASDLGDPPLRALFRIARPRLYWAIVLAYFIIFLPLLGEVSAPYITGGSSGALYANLIERNFTVMRDFSGGAAAAVALVVAACVMGLAFTAPYWLRLRGGGR